MQATPTSNQKNVYILAFTLVVVTLGFGVVIPIMPFYVERLGAGGIELGLLVASYAVMRLIFGPIWGGLSDRFGRKPILMVGVFGYAITMVWFGLATKLWVLFVARSLSGILSSATSPTTMAYISDSTTEEQRSHGMGILGASVGLGTVLGPGIGGLLAGDSPTGASLSLPFFIAGGLSLVSMFLIAILLPESLPVRARQSTDQGIKIIQIHQLRDALFSPIGILLIMAFLMSYALTTFYGIFGLYALEKYSYGPQQVGLVITVVSLVSVVAQGLLTGPLTKRWGETIVIRITLIATAIGFIFILLAYSLSTVLLAAGFFSLATALLAPAIIALTSKRTTIPQGITMGISNAFISLGRIVGPLWAGFSFDININYPYLSSGGVMLLGFISSLLWVTQKSNDIQLGLPQTDQFAESTNPMEGGPESRFRP